MYEFEKKEKAAQKKEKSDDVGKSSGASVENAASNRGELSLIAQAESVNRTGLPDRLKANVEAMSGLSLDAVRVHYNSEKPAGIQAYAYTRGTDIYVAPGQERHLPHETWHVVQQARQSVPSTKTVNGVKINDDSALEHEADVMGEAAQRAVIDGAAEKLPAAGVGTDAPVQRIKKEVKNAIAALPKYREIIGLSEAEKQEKYKNPKANYRMICRMFRAADVWDDAGPANVYDIARMLGIQALDPREAWRRSQIEKPDLSLFDNADAITAENVDDKILSYVIAYCKTVGFILGNIDDEPVYHKPGATDDKPFWQIINDKIHFLGVFKHDDAKDDNSLYENTTKRISNIHSIEKVKGQKKLKYNGHY